MLSTFVKIVSYRAGFLGLLHRKRNRRTLTAVMFHRVLSAGDPRWTGADPEYTLETSLFEQCIEFLQQHYNFVSLQDVLDARANLRPLPDRALLVTFDDGWADNAEYALPILHAKRIPAVMFVVADAVGTQQPFWQERLRSAELRGFAAPPPFDSWSAVHAALQAMPADHRSQWMLEHDEALDDAQRQMVDLADLVNLQDGGVALGLHGKSHVPMREAADLHAELEGARETLGNLLAEAGRPAPSATMSFPHGSYDAIVADKARAAGYQLAFTSVPGLNAIDPSPSWLLARTGFEAAAVTDMEGRFRPYLLALYLFRRPVKRLA